MALENWIDRIDGVDKQTAKDINDVANAVVELEVITETIVKTAEDANLAANRALDVVSEIKRDVFTQISALMETKPPIVSPEDKGAFLRVDALGVWNKEFLEIAEESEY